MTDVWERRLRRAEQLEKEWPFAADLLRFFRTLTQFQSDVYRLVSDPAIRCALDDGDLLPLLPPAMKLFDLVQEHGPETLAGAAGELERGSQEETLRLLSDFLHRSGELDPLVSFFPNVLLQPRAMTIAGGDEEADLPSGACRHCGRAPLVSVLREDKVAETVRRTLVCSFCSAEWEFPRVLCPRCREERPAKLPRLTAIEVPWMRVDACDTCRTYVKSIDLTRNPDAEPVVDELASTPLDVIARERGYTKLATNLAGL
jgi:FdhE protein